MATVPKNFVTQREEVWLNTIQASAADDARAEVMWAGTTDGTTVVTTKSVSGNQTDLDEVKNRVGSINEVQEVKITGSPTGGTFTLTFDGQATSGIAYNASTSAVETALEGLSNIDTDEVVVTGGPLPGTAILVQFVGGLGGTNLPQMTASGASLSGGTTPSVSVLTVTNGQPAL